MTAFIRVNAGTQGITARTLVPVGDIRFVQATASGARLLVGVSMRDSTTLDVTESVEEIERLIDNHP